MWKHVRHSICHPIHSHNDGQLWHIKVKHSVSPCFVQVYKLRFAGVHVAIDNANK